MSSFNDMYVGYDCSQRNCCHMRMCPITINNELTIRSKRLERISTDFLSDSNANQPHTGSFVPLVEQLRDIIVKLRTPTPHVKICSQHSQKSPKSVTYDPTAAQLDRNGLQFITILDIFETHLRYFCHSARTYCTLRKKSFMQFTN